jgi:hypothetical protein
MEYFLNVGKSRRGDDLAEGLAILLITAGFAIALVVIWLMGG